MKTIGEHPRCPSYGVLMRDADDGWACPACGTNVAIESIDPSGAFDGPSIHGG
ncbi:hypothetical protein [Microbacterium schleiferi]|uniref:Uncharacterized protein n=1 Tax=Microbacterium schleiferi TaxID=69362 RepID=A0ABU7VAE2_9MICO|nr:hypothetical protein [Bifidobacterium pseudolongum subsp. globosum]